MVEIREVVLFRNFILVLVHLNGRLAAKLVVEEWRTLLMFPSDIKAPAFHAAM